MYSSLPEDWTHNAFAEIDLSALKNNYRKVKTLITERSPHTRIIAVIKADAYGHGANACAEALIEEGCDFFAVASLSEAMSVYRFCAENKQQVSILILGHTPVCYVKELASANLIQSLLSAEYAHALQQAAKAAGVTVRAHVAVDSGMNRIGFPAKNSSEIDDTVCEIASVCSLSNLRVEGMFSHLAAADSPKGSTGADFTATQYARYQAVKEQLEKKAVKIPFHHLSNSAASLLGKEPWLMDGARVGIFLYGANPCHTQKTLELLPVMKLKTKIIHVHRLPAGEPLGYGCAFIADTPRVIATLPIGYADGFLRKYQGTLVTVHHKNATFEAPVVGKICMDQCMIDITGFPAEVGDEVVLFGSTPEQLSRLSSAADTIDYETICLISSRVPRIYLDQEKPKS